MTYNLSVCVCVFGWIFKYLLDSVPFQADDKRRCCGSNGQKSGCSQDAPSKQLTSGNTAHPWILTAKPIQNSSNHPKSKKISDVENMAIQNTRKASHFCGSKKRPTMVFVIGLFSEHRRTSAEGFRFRSLDITVEPWAEVWDEDSSRSPEIKKQNKFWKESNSAISAISYDSNPLPFPIKYSKNCTCCLPKNKRQQRP